ncbi:MAG: hypothetical protein IKA31_00585 [Clostridia bacterium]|nr:hypothetical protein [Clostridia bacterium]
MTKLRSKNILIKYSEIGLDGLNKVDEKITDDLRSVSWEDIESLSKEEFSKISLPLLYDWAHITGQGAEMQDKIAQLANKYKSDKEKYKMLKESKLYNNQFESIVKTIIKEQKASISMLQRLYEISFPKAQAYIDELLSLGFIEKNDRYYKVLVSEKEI